MSKYVIDISKEIVDLCKRDKLHFEPLAELLENQVANATPLDQVLEEIKGEIEKEKCYRGITGNPAIDKHDIGLDRYFDRGLERALKIIDKHIGKEKINDFTRSV